MARLWKPLAIALAAAVMMAPTARADYPDRPIRIVLGFPGGGGADIMVRYFGEKLQALSGATVVIENKPGAGGNLGTDLVAKARPDGYTILMVPSSAIAGNVHIYKNLPFDPIKDLEPITTLAELGFVLAINPDLTPAKNVAELTTFLKSKAGKVTYGAATTTALACAAHYRAAAGIEAVPVSYKATAQALADVTAGQITFVFADTLFAVGQEKAGKVKLLAVTTGRRVAALPNVPTMEEAGVSGAELAPWWAAFAPAKTPPEVRAKLAGWLDQIVAMPETKAFLADMATDPLPGSADLVRQRLAAEIERWGEIVKLTNIEPQ